MEAWVPNRCPQGEEDPWKGLQPEPLHLLSLRFWGALRECEFGRLTYRRVSLWLQILSRDFIPPHTQHQIPGLPASPQDWGWKEGAPSLPL